MCFGSNETSYLGFRLTKDGIFPGRDKLKAVRDAQAPENFKQIRQFLVISFEDTFKTSHK
jgi:hypothetical protein